MPNINFQTSVINTQIFVVAKNDTKIDLPMVVLSHNVNYYQLTTSII